MNAPRGGQRRGTYRFRRRLTLTHAGRPFLDRWGLVWDRFGGFYLHHISGPDPGLDLHDHPWSFVSIILRGAYVELTSPAREARGDLFKRWRRWERWTIHRMPLTVAHRISHAEPGTWTLVLRGPTRRMWGFFTPDGWVPFDRYDYEARRPMVSVGNSMIDDPTAAR